MVFFFRICLLPYVNWVSFVCLYIILLQGLANVLSTGEKKIILATTNLCRNLCKRIRKKRKGSQLPSMGADNTSNIQIESMPDNAATITASNLI